MIKDDEKAPYGGKYVRIIGGLVRYLIVHETKVEKPLPLPLVVVDAEPPEPALLTDAEIESQLD